MRKTWNPPAPLSKDVRVRAPGNKTFGDYVGIVTNAFTSVNYRRVVFPGHPWQTGEATWAFRVDELAIVEQGNADSK